MWASWKGSVGWVTLSHYRVINVSMDANTTFTIPILPRVRAMLDLFANSINSHISFHALTNKALLVEVFIHSTGGLSADTLTVAILIFDIAFHASTLIAIKLKELIRATNGPASSPEGIIGSSEGTTATFILYFVIPRLAPAKAAIKLLIFSTADHTALIEGIIGIVRRALSTSSINSVIIFFANASAIVSYLFIFTTF